MLLMIRYRPSGLSWWTNFGIESPPSLSLPDSLVNQGHQFTFMFTKLQIFNMTTYATVLYLHADTMVLRSISDVFDVSVPAMVLKNVHLGWSLDLGNVSDWGDVTERGRCNAGVLVVRPSVTLLSGMIALSHRIHFNPQMSEQGLLNAYFENAEQYNCRHIMTKRTHEHVRPPRPTTSTTANTTRLHCKQN